MTDSTTIDGTTETAVSARFGSVDEIFKSESGRDILADAGKLRLAIARTNVTSAAARRALPDPNGRP